MSDVTDAPPRAATSEDAQSSAHGSHIWYELMTPDPVAAKPFYEAIVPAWTIGERNPGEIDYRMIGRSDGGNAGGVLRMGDDMREHGARPLWLGYICVDDIDATLAQLQSKGGQAHMPATDIAGVGRIAMVADPQGNAFYVMTPKPPEGGDKSVSDVFSRDAEQRVGWNELSTSDPVAARAFYGDLFGWTSDEFMPMPVPSVAAGGVEGGEYGEYRFFYHGSTMIGAVSGIAPGDSQGWRYYVRVPSIPRSVEAVKAGGGTIAMGPIEVPGGDHIIVGHDPQGAEFALVGKL